MLDVRGTHLATTKRAQFFKKVNVFGHVPHTSWIVYTAVWVPAQRHQHKNAFLSQQGNTTSLHTTMTRPSFWAMLYTHWTTSGIAVQVRKKKLATTILTTWTVRMSSSAFSTPSGSMLMYTLQNSTEETHANKVKCRNDTLLNVHRCQWRWHQRGAEMKTSRQQLHNSPQCITVQSVGRWVGSSNRCLCSASLKLCGVAEDRSGVTYRWADFDSKDDFASDWHLCHCIAGANATSHWGIPANWSNTAEI